MNRLQTFGDLKREIAIAAIDEPTRRTILSAVEKIQKEIDYTQQGVERSTTQKGEFQVRRPGIVRVPLKWGVQNTDYKVDTTLLTRDPETGALSLATSAPRYDRRRKDSFDVDCSTSGKLKWAIEAF